MREGDYKRKRKKKSKVNNPTDQASAVYRCIRYQIGLTILIEKSRIFPLSYDSHFETDMEKHTHKLVRFKDCRPQMTIQHLWVYIQRAYIHTLDCHLRFLFRLKMSTSHEPNSAGNAATSISPPSSYPLPEAQFSEIVQNRELFLEKLENFHKSIGSKIK